MKHKPSHPIARVRVFAALAVLALGAVGCVSGVNLPGVSGPAGPAGPKHPAISGVVVGSDGAPVRNATIHGCDQGHLVKLEKEFKPGKYRNKIPPSLVLSCKSCDSKCGSFARTDDQGRFSKEVLPDNVRTLDLIIYRNDWKPLIIRGVTPPRDLGVVRLPGRDSEPHPNGLTIREVK